MKKPLLDEIQKRVVSRKFLVWLTTVIALFSGLLSGSEFVQVSGIYLGIEGLIDAGALFRRSQDSFVDPEKYKVE